jgi:heme-degrading monooxygenase HmoA
MSAVAPIASFHLVRDHAVFSNVTRLGLDRRRLQHTEGLQFWRLMGTGDGRNTGPSADLRRRAVFAVWHDDMALDQFLRSSPVAQAWREAEEAWHVRLRFIGGGGLWRGREILRDMTAATGDPGPIVTLTRANVRPKHWRTFAKVSRQTNIEVAASAGLLRVVGVGEAPIGKQATISIWQNEHALKTFAYRNPGHIDVMRRTREEGWYSEELFARFQPYASTGSWDGEDPLALAAR